jgi:hypothetical protein
MHDNDKIITIFILSFLQGGVVNSSLLLGTEVKGCLPAILESKQKVE